MMHDALLCALVLLRLIMYNAYEAFIFFSSLNKGPPAGVEGGTSNNPTPPFTTEPISVA